MNVHFRQVSIIGVGLIGGSLGMVLKQQRLADEVVGVGRRVEQVQRAVTLGAIDRSVPDATEAVRSADLVVLATPVDSYEQHLRAWGAAVPAGAIVTDVGSVKGRLVERVESLLPETVRFVGAHPIAGREKTGVDAGSVALFQGARCILTPTRRTAVEAIATVRRLWEAAGSVVSTMDPYLHDRVLGAVSHLPHVAAFALMNALVAQRHSGVPEGELFSYAGGGLRDTTRIAASSPEMWRDIFLWNRDNVVALIDGYQQELNLLKRLILTEDGPGIEKALEQAKAARTQLNHSWRV